MTIPENKSETQPEQPYIFGPDSSPTLDEGETYTANPNDDYEQCADVWALLVRDGLDYPISRMPVRVEMPGERAVVASTNDEGSVVLPAPKVFEGEAVISVKGIDGKFQEVCKIDLAQCETGAIIQSPKVAAPLQTKTREHAISQAATPPSSQAPSPATSQPACTVIPPDGMWYEVNQALEKAWTWLSGRVHESDKKQPACGASTARAEKPNISARHVVKESASVAGNPVTVVVGPECPSADNLRLGRNNIYRDAIIKAASRCGLMPQAMAALIDAEAAKKSESIPVLGPDGKPAIVQKTGKPKVKTIKEQWNKDSYNATSRAAGLTQFLESTWLGHVMIPGRYIHEQSVAKGWVRRDKDAVGRPVSVFVLANGKTTQRPSDNTSDANVQACLKERYTAAWAIMAAADYGKTNLDLLETKGFKVKSLNDAEKAKLMYLMHHEGEGNGPLFIRNELHLMPKKKFASAEARLRSIFVQQVGEKEATKRIDDTDNDIANAYRTWLANYVDLKIKLESFMCSFSDSEKPRDLLVVCERVGK